MTDIFRPSRQPARDIYDAFKAEAQLRSQRSVPEWIESERNAVWTAAKKAAVELGLIEPTLDDITRAECSASGHVDYGAKWALGVVDAMYGRFKGG